MKAGRTVHDPEELKQLERLFRDMGLTDEQTARSLSQRAGSPLAGVGERIEQAVERDLQKLGSMDADSLARLRQDRGCGRPWSRATWRHTSSRSAPPLLPQGDDRGPGSLAGAYPPAGVEKSGPFDEDLLRDYLYARRDNLDEAIRAISPSSDAKTFNDLLDFFVSRGGKITKVPSSQEVSAWKHRAARHRRRSGLQASPRRRPQGPPERQVE